MRTFVIASHHLLASGLKDTLIFLTNSTNLVDISAYMEEEDLKKRVETLMNSFGQEDEVIILTDMLGGSVNQTFYPYMSQNHHLVAGVNLPCALSLVLQPTDQSLTGDRIQQIVEESRNHLIYVNAYKDNQEEDDE